LVRFITLPGIGGSGDAHWQSAWERSDPRFIRFSPSSWDEPDLADWIAALDRSVAAEAAPPVLVAHSLACLLVAHWARASARPAAGALLVATPDPSGPEFPAVAAGFAGAPAAPLRFPALVVASENDPYGAIGYARTCARAWGAGFVLVGAAGHINGSSGLGDWPQGRALFEAFCAGAGVVRAQG
jgi:predicted alpha/beta hydrolase family esterase